MNDIETIYTQYEDIVAEFSEQVIKNRYSSLYKECIVFLESLGIHDSVRRGVLGFPQRKIRVYTDRFFPDTGPEIRDSG